MILLRRADKICTIRAVFLIAVKFCDNTMWVGNVQFRFSFWFSIPFFGFFCVFLGLGGFGRWGMCYTWILTPMTFRPNTVLNCTKCERRWSAILYTNTAAMLNDELTCTEEDFIGVLGWSLCKANHSLLVVTECSNEWLDAAEVEEMVLFALPTKVWALAKCLENMLNTFCANFESNLDDLSRFLF